MRLDDRGVDLLAGAFVLGLLSARTRRRFEALQRRDARLRTACVAWEERLAPLASLAPSVRPGPGTWGAIAARLEARSAPARAAGGSRWRAALAAAFVGAALAISWAYHDRATTPAYTASMYDAQGLGLWEFSATAGASQITVRALRPDLVPAGRSYELWAVFGDGGGAPVSLGLITSDEYTYLDLHDAQRRALRAAQSFAVTNEPAGGAPGGVATGPLVQVSPVSRRG